MLFNPNQAISSLLTFRYFILFPITVVEGPIITVLAGFLASLGYFNFYAAYAVIVAGDLTGDVLWYCLGYYGRDGLIKKWGRFFDVTIQRVEHLEKYFEKHSGKTLALGKLFHGIGTTFLVAAGAAKMPFGKYFLYNFAATLPKSLALLLIGFYFGQAFGKINSYLEFTANLTIGLGLLLTVGFFVYSWHKNKNSNL